MIDPNKVILDGGQSDAIIGAQAAEIRRLRLTDEEREAIAWIALTHSRLKTAGDRPGRTKEMDLDAVWGFLDRTK